MTDKIILASTSTGVDIGGVLKGLGPLGFETTDIGQGAAVELLNKVLSGFIGILTICGAIFFIIQFILGAFSYMTSGGDKTLTENARKQLINAVIGLTILVAAVFLADFIGALLGLDLLNPGKFILGIWGGTI